MGIGKLARSFGMAAAMMAGTDKALSQPPMTPQIKDNLECVGALTNFSSDPDLSNQFKKAHMGVEPSDVAEHYVRSVAMALGEGAQKAIIETSKKYGEKMETSEGLQSATATAASCVMRYKTEAPSR
jgi:hypothetical protein